MEEGRVLLLSGRGRLLGHLEAAVANQVLLAWKAVVCYEGISTSGNFYENKLSTWLSSTSS